MDGLRHKYEQEEPTTKKSKEEPPRELSAASDWPLTVGLRLNGNGGFGPDDSASFHRLSAGYADAASWRQQLATVWTGKRLRQLPRLNISFVGHVVVWLGVTMGIWALRCALGQD